MNRITRTTAAGIVAGALLLAGCGSESDGASGTDSGAASEQATTFEIVDAWARTSPASADNGAAYFEITASADDALVGAEVSTDVAETAEIHEVVMAEDSGMTDDTSMSGDDMSGDEMTDDTSMSGDEMTDDTSMSGDDMSGDSGDMSGDDMDMGNMTMQEVDSIDLPAGEAVVFEPGGYHVMLLGLASPLEVGDTFDLTLMFESGASETVTVEVREG